MNYQLSILIPGRNEEFLGRTVKDIIDHSSDKTEVIAVIDGEGDPYDIELHPRVTVVLLQKSVGQREATNIACRLSSSPWVAKTDGHCSFAQGFDEILLADITEDTTMVPVMRNLHVFDWVCPKGHRRYQGPSGPCIKCKQPTKKDILWIGKSSPQSKSYCFDSEPHFQYFSRFSKRPEGRGSLTPSMSLQGSFFMLSRKKYWDLEISSNKRFGSWGSQGIEVAAKTWLTGGRVIVNHKTWYAHMFRTQGGDFGFPYAISHKETLKNRKKVKEYFFEGKWGKQIYPVSFLLEKFWPVQGWTEQEYINQKNLELKSRRSGIVSIENLVNGQVFPFGAENISESCLFLLESLRRGGCSAAGLQKEWNLYGEGNFHWHVELFCRERSIEKLLKQYTEQAAKGKIKHPKIDSKTLTKGILYYTDNRLDPRIFEVVQEQLKFSGLPITSVSLAPLAFGKNISLNLNRGVETMTRQILTGLESMTEDIIFFCEHDVLYPKSHFNFTPIQRDMYYYNVNVWKLNTEWAYAVKVDDCRQLSGLCVFRDTAISHYREKLKRIQAEGYSNKIGHEPGTHSRKERIDELESETWASPDPLVDIRHSQNYTATRWKPEEFRNKQYTEGWTESYIIPHWGDCTELMEKIYQLESVKAS